MKRFIRWGWAARLGWLALTGALAYWAHSYYTTWAGTAIPAFGPVEPYVTAWRRALLWHLGVGMVLVPAWLWISFNLWHQGEGDPVEEESPEFHRTSS